MRFRFLSLDSFIFGGARAGFDFLEGMIGEFLIEFGVENRSSKFQVAGFGARGGLGLGKFRSRRSSKKVRLLDAET
jgi:hypothetical protein